jgi:4-hydroxy-tetrahydrodipicolinate reductase
MDNVQRVVRESGGALVYGANFSIGVNLFYRIVARAAELFEGLEDYAPFIEEAHHARKRDAPSGTALRLRELLQRNAPQEVPIASTRAGHIPGTHRVGFDSASDQITLTHTARTREGFAAGALLAARWIQGRAGVYEFSEMLEEILNEGMKG